MRDVEIRGSELTRDGFWNLPQRETSTHPTTSRKLEGVTIQEACPRKYSVDNELQSYSSHEQILAQKADPHNPEAAEDAEDAEAEEHEKPGKVYTPKKIDPYKTEGWLRYLAQRPHKSDDLISNFRDAIKSI